jgi:hypothetical protein
MPKQLESYIDVDDPFPVIQRIREGKAIYYPLANTDEIPEEEPLPPVIETDVIALKEITVTAKAIRPYRDKVLGRLDSLAQMDLGVWVDDRGVLENYREGYTAHPPEFPAYEGERRLPVRGERYRLVKVQLTGWYNNIGLPSYVPLEHIEVVYEGFSDEELMAMHQMKKIKGYYGRREFYRPDEVDMLTPLPDSRNTLIWEPSVLTDANGEATLSFYCSDLNTRFVGRIEGLADGGLPGVAACEFRVLKIQPLRIGKDKAPL